MPKNWEEMCCTQKGVKMNNWAQMLTLLDVWTNLPHLCLTIKWSTNSQEPLNKSTLVLFAIVRKGEKQLDVHNIHSTHPRFLFILNYESTISMWCFSLSHWAGSDVFPVHSVKATFITRGKKGGNGRVKYRYFTLNHWAVFKVNIIRSDIIICVDLVKEKTAS